MVDWIVSELPGLIVAFALGLCGQWIWARFYVAKRDLEAEHRQKEREFLQLLENVINEIDFNCKPGIGDEKCLFRLAAHALLADSLNIKLSSEMKENIKLILYEGGLCNAGRLQNGITPNRVKEMSRLLKKQLWQFMPAEKTE